jgi:hypothetical protein
VMSRRAPTNELLDGHIKDGGNPRDQPPPRGRLARLPVRDRRLVKPAHLSESKLGEFPLEPDPSDLSVDGPNKFFRLACVARFHTLRLTFNPPKVKHG